MADKIDRILNLTPIEKNELHKLENQVKELKNNHTSEDFEFARGHIISAVETMSTAVNELSDIAGQSQHPRAYDALTSAAKALSTMSKELLEIQKINIDVERTAGDISKPNVVNQNLFVGSTAELLDILEKTDKK